MWNWNERPTKVSSKLRIGGERPAIVYDVGKEHAELVKAIQAEG